MPTKLTRRRFISVVGAAVGVAALPRSSRAKTQMVEWRGQALGAEASIKLLATDTARATQTLEICAREIHRLETIFSLYRPDSEINRLNNTGALPSPSPEMRQLLTYGQQVSAETRGAFDATVQPLWQLYRDHFSKPGAEPSGPNKSQIETTRRLVDWRRLSISETAISLGKAGMAITLNGIAQGYITDKIADLLKSHGVENVYVDLGEIRPLGEASPGKPWQVGVANPAGTGFLEVLELKDRAVATSGGYGTAFNRNGTIHHLFDPRNGGGADHWRSVTVVADRATEADALSTALAVSSYEESRRILDGKASVQAILLDRDGRRLNL